MFAFNNWNGARRAGVAVGAAARARAETVADSDSHSVAIDELCMISLYRYHT